MILFFISFLVLYFVVATPIASTNNNQRIVGGFDAYAGQFPYQVSIRFALIGIHLCGGSIISDQWILTSATGTIHPAQLLRIVVGSIYLNSGGVTYEILYSVRHPDYDHEIIAVNDIGLIRIKGQIVFSEFVSPIKLNSASSSIGLPFTVTGWGSTNISNPNTSNTLQYVILASIPISDCQKRFPNIPLYDTNICTYSSFGQGICIADYGNPLVYRGEQHAIGSLIALCGNGVPDIHTNVASFREWIKEISNV